MPIKFILQNFDLKFVLKNRSELKKKKEKKNKKKKKIFVSSNII